MARSRAVSLLWLHPRRFYDGSPGRRVVPCPGCGGPADEAFGDHGGGCRQPDNPAQRGPGRVKEASGA